MGDPATDKWLAEEMGWTPEQIALRNAQIDSAGPKPPGTRTPQEQEADILTAALQDLGIDLADKEFVAFEKWLSEQFGLDSYRGRFKGTWEDWVKKQAQAPATVPSALPGELVGEPEVVAGEAPLKGLLAQWQAGQEARREAEALPKREAARRKAITKEQERRDALTKAQLKDVVADLKRRYPNNKNVLDALAEGNPTLGLPSAFESAWGNFNARQQEVAASLPPELRGILGGTEGDVPDVPIDSFVRSLDIGQFAAAEGLGDFWQDGMLKDAIQRQVYDPILAAAKTPQDKLSAENKITKLQGSYNGLLRAFNFAQQEDSALTADAFMAGTGGDLVAQVQANNQARLSDLIKAAAAAGKNAAQIQAELQIGPGDLVGAGAARALQQGKLIADQIERGRQAKAQGDINAATQAYVSAIEGLGATSVGTPEELARTLGTTLVDLQRLNPAFNDLLTQTADRNKLFNLQQAQQRQVTANNLPILQRAVASGALTPEAARELVGRDLNVPADLRELETRTNAAGQQELVRPITRTLGQDLESASGSLAYYERERQASAERALAAGRNLSANARGILDYARSEAGSLQSYELDLAGGDASQADLPERAQQARMFANPEFYAYLSQRAEIDASDYADELAEFARTGGIAAGRPQHLLTQEFNIRSKLPTIFKEFQEEQKRVTAAKATARAAKPVYPSGVI